MTTRNFIAAILSASPQPVAAATADPEAEANLVASGAGVRTSLVNDKISHTDFAPIVAKLAGVEMPDVAGHALHTVLTP